MSEDQKSALSDPTPLAGKVALITGASRRIGRATAIGLAHMGADVVVHAHAAKEEIEATATAVRATGRRAQVVMGDVAKEAEAQRLVGEARDAFGRLDILVNNAAIRRQAPFLEMSYADWREILDVILDGAFLCSRAALPALIETGDGRIVNLGGVSAHIGVQNRAHVAAAKAGLVGPHPRARHRIRRSGRAGELRRAGQDRRPALRHLRRVAGDGPQDPARPRGRDRGGGGDDLRDLRAGRALHDRSDHPCERGAVLPLIPKGRRAQGAAINVRSGATTRSRRARQSAR